MCPSVAETEQRCALIEKETLGLVFGCEKIHSDVYGFPTWLTNGWDSSTDRKWTTPKRRGVWNVFRKRMEGQDFSEVGPSSFVVKTENGQVLRRNRSLLKTQDTENQTEVTESGRQDDAAQDWDWETYRTRLNCYSWLYEKEKERKKCFVALEHNVVSHNCYWLFQFCWMW